MRKVMILSGNLAIESHFYKYPIIKLIGYLLFASTLISCSPHGQNRRRNPEVKEAKTAGQIISDMKTEIRLTDEQKVNIRPIIEEQVKNRKELIKKYQGRDCRGTDCLKDDLKDLRINTETQLQYFLTNDQMIQYGNMQQEEDQRIMGITSAKTQEEVTQEKPRSRGHRSGRL